MKTNTKFYSTPIQLKLPLDIEKIIETSDPIYTFNEVIDHMDLNQYFADKERKTGRPKCDRVILLKIVLFAFMEYGYASLREMEKLCKTDIRFLWLLDGRKAPSYVTIANFINQELRYGLEEIWQDINQYIFTQEGVDLEHMYLDGTKMVANAGKSTWVWKKSCIRNRRKVFEKLTDLLNEINETTLLCMGVRIGTREEYDIRYIEKAMAEFLSLTGLDPGDFKHGRGYRKSQEQKQYEKLEEYCQRLRTYAKQINICGEKRNSYSKTDHGATFMRMKQDHMGNGELLPAYNVQLGVCDGYIAVVDVEQYASDMDCFIPVLEQFKEIYGKYPRYPVADAGYGSYNNYLYCEEHGMEKYMKFTMYEKETKDKKYQSDPFRAVNFPRDEKGNLTCPNGKKFLFLERRPVKGNRYGRTEELYQCEDCEGCPYQDQCKKGKGNRTLRLNEELSAIHEEVLRNLNCIHGALLRMNRCIQAEGAFGTIKWNKAYRRARRKGLDRLNLELKLVSCGFNLHKYDLRRQAAARKAA